MASQILIPCVVLLVVIVVAFQVTKVAEDRVRKVVEGQLRELRASTQVGLQIWLDSRERAVGLAASQPDVYVECNKLLQAFAIDPTPKNIQQSTEFRRLLSAIRGAASRYGTGDFVLLNEMGVCVAASHPGLIGTKNPYEETKDAFDVALLGKPIVTRPFLSAYVANPLRRSEPKVATMFAFAPVRNENDVWSGVLGLRVDPRGGFSKVLHAARLGETGEAYLVDSTGQLLTMSRFEDDLVIYGLLPKRQSSVLAIQVRDPQIDLSTGEPYDPEQRGDWTESVKGLIGMSTKGSEQEGVNVRGYRDYRGVKVVGAWSWLENYNMGLITEIDYEEAFGGMKFIRYVLFGSIALLVLSLAANSFGSVFLARLRRRMERSRQLGQYTLERKIGAGGMGQIYLARHSLLRRPTALKVMETANTTQEDRLRFEREVQHTSELSHPNTISIYDYGHTPDGVFYYVMEYLEGLDLQTLVNNFGPCAPGRVVHILDQVCASLEEAHEKGLIHRDIKPANIYMCERGGMPDVVKVLDFGLVKHLDEGSAAINRHEALSGTPGYLAPEVIRQPTAAGVQSDLYCVAAIGYFLITGRNVFSGETVMDVLDKHLHADPKPPSLVLGSEIPSGLEGLLMQCLEKDPNKRLQSATQFRLRLKHSGVTWHERLAHAWWDANRDAIREMNGDHAESSTSKPESALATIEIRRTPN